jgi:exodeoxyribonuclease V alpha subunit
MYAALVNAFERFRVPKNAVCAAVAKAFGERLPALIRDKNGREISTVVAAPRDIKKFLALCPDRLDLAAQLAACVPQRLLRSAADTLASADEVRADPYSSIRRCGGSLADADACAARVGMSPEARDAARMAWTFDDVAGRNGHTLLRAPELAERLRFELGVPPDVARARVDAAVEAGALVRCGDGVTTRAQYDLDLRLAAEIRRRRGAVVELRVECPPGLSTQQTAAHDAITTRLLSVITGGPGTGKSYAVGLIVEAARAAGLEVATCAPTGKAARNVAGRTVHYHALRSRVGAKRGDDDLPASLDLLVVDEASMLTDELLAAVFDMVPPECHVALVGDADQLPPVGAGACLTDLIASGPVVRLEHQHRSLDRIGRLAGEVLAGKLAPAPEELVECATLDAAVDECVRAAVEGIQVLAPQNAHRIRINQLTQAKVFPGDARKTFETADKGSRAGTGDRVIVTKNTPDAKNGDLGEIAEYVNATTAAVRLDTGETVKLPAYNVALAYATTVHKFQGSETDAVCVPLLAQFGWDTQLLYTAVTRARTRVLFAGQAATEIRARAPRRTALAFVLAQ